MKNDAIYIPLLVNIPGFAKIFFFQMLYVIEGSKIWHLGQKKFPQIYMGLDMTLGSSSDPNIWVKYDIDSISQTKHYKKNSITFIGKVVSLNETNILGHIVTSNDLSLGVRLPQTSKPQIFKNVIKYFRIL